MYFVLGILRVALIELFDGMALSPFDLHEFCHGVEVLEVVALSAGGERQQVGQVVAAVDALQGGTEGLLTIYLNILPSGRRGF